MRHCSHCQNENPSSANFCGNCGNLVAPNCPRCQAAVPHSVNFCYQCGLPVKTQTQIQWVNPPQLEQDQSINRSTKISAPQVGLSVPLPQSGSSTDVSSGMSMADKLLPPELADKISLAKAAGAMDGERRVVSMLFCDVKGSTAAAEKLDPEEWTEIINGAFEHMIQPVYKYEGTVARLMGDGILAFFGAPISHEDDPERAVLTGLEIVSNFKVYQEEILERHGFEITARVGINTGLVVVGVVGSDQRMEYTAMGDAINLAARMEQTATPGTVQIAEPTYRLVERLFEFEALGGIEVKGKAEPVQAYRVLAQSNINSGMREVAGLQSPMIGRDQDLATIQEILASAQQKIGHILCISGDAGVGKSRLIQEAQAEWDKQGITGRWESVSSQSYESNHAYGLIQRLLRQLNQITVTDSPSVLREKMADMLSYFPEERQTRVTQIFDTMFGIPSEGDLPRVEGETFKNELFSALLHIWNHHFASDPTVIVFENLQWSDSASIQLIAHLFTTTNQNPLVMICAFRDERDTPVKYLQNEISDNYAHRATELELKSLPDADINIILNELIGVGDLPDDLRQNVLDQAGGNPFFVEEVVRGLILNGYVITEELEIDGQSKQVCRINSDAVAMAIPENLQSLLTARIDRLGEGEKNTLQLAAVIGRSFAERVLTQLSLDVAGAGQDINNKILNLLKLQIIQEATRIPEVSFNFRNPLTQEVVYNGILLKGRRLYHKNVALVMEELYSNQLIDVAPQLAFHFQKARAKLKAFEYYVIAGDQARQLFALDEALTHYEQALNLVDMGKNDVDEVVALYINYGRVLENAGRHQDALDAYELLKSIGEEENNRSVVLKALVACGTLRSTLTPFMDFELAEELAKQGLVLANEVEDKEAESAIYWNLLMVAAMRGEAGDDALGIEYGEKSLALARELDMRPQVALTLNNLARTYRSANQLEKANEAVRESRELLLEVGNLPMLADSYSQQAYLYNLSGNLDMAETEARETGRIADSIGNIWNQGMYAWQLGFAKAERGHFEDAVNILMAGSEIEGMATVPFAHGATIGPLAEVLIELRALPMARKKLHDVLYAGTDDHPVAQMLNPTLARIDILEGNLAAAEKNIDFETKGGDTLTIAYNLMPIRHAQIDYYLAKGDAVAAKQEVLVDIDYIKKFGAVVYLPGRRLLYAKALQIGGDIVGAKKELAQAVLDAEKIGSHRVLWAILAMQAEIEKNAKKAKIYKKSARVELEYILGNLTDINLRETFLKRVEVAQLLDD